MLQLQLRLPISHEKNYFNFPALKSICHLSDVLRFSFTATVSLLPDPLHFLGTVPLYLRHVGLHQFEIDHEKREFQFSRLKICLSLILCLPWLFHDFTEIITLLPDPLNFVGNLSFSIENVEFPITTCLALRSFSFSTQATNIEIHV